MPLGVVAVLFGAGAAATLISISLMLLVCAEICDLRLVNQFPWLNGSLRSLEQRDAGRRRKGGCVVRLMKDECGIVELEERRV